MEELLKELYLNPETRIDKEPLASRQHFWPRHVNLKDLFQFPKIDTTTTIEPVLDSITAEVIGFEEVPVPHAEENPGNSSSLQRRPGPREEFYKGSQTHFPFRPGGFDVPAKPALDHNELFKRPWQEVFDFENGGEILTCPPGWDEELILGDHFPDDTAPAAQQSSSGISHLSGLLAPFALPTHHAEYQQSIYYSLLDAAKEEEANRKVRLENIFRTDKMEEELMLEEESEDEAEEPDSNVQAPVAAAAANGPDVSQPDIPTPRRAMEAEDNVEDLDDLLGNPDELSPRKHATRKKEAPTERWAEMDRADVSKFKELVPNPALQYPFELDVFQKQAIMHMENGESVFVSAHTSAGKTVVAEYAIALCQRHCTRAVYTSPIKTLSNQKFRDFKTRFNDVGIITGDVSVNPTAACLIMTTEILRSMLYKGADLIRDIEWVIFDEVHYVNDPERGVVWEEVIIMLPAHTNLVLLSATVPNVLEFADWIGRTKRKKVYVMSTYKRPVPLEHHLYLGGNELYRVVDPHSQFLEGQYKTALAFFKEKEKKNPYKQGGRNLKQERNQWVALVELLRKKNLLPVVVFSFSKRRCEEAAFGLTNTDLCSGSERSVIHVFIEQALGRLKGTDRELPQILRIRDLLKQGIGVHHAGLLPIVKEVVELLFQRGLVKVLFATETFAMGVNMPARTVVFNGWRKNDGKQFRDLLPGEYTQMSGRAGRRGLDTSGIVLVTCWDKIPDVQQLQQLILGTPTKLESQFRLTYNMILNLLRVEDMRVEDMIRRSFSEFELQRRSSDMQQMLDKGKSRIARLPKVECSVCGEQVHEFFHLASRHASLTSSLYDWLLRSRASSQFITPGRVLLVSTSRNPALAFAVVLKCATPADKIDTNHTLVALVLLPPTQQASRAPSGPLLPTPGAARPGSKSSVVLSSGSVGGRGYEVAEIALKEIVALCSRKLKIDATRIVDGARAQHDALHDATQGLTRLSEEFGIGTLLDTSGTATPVFLSSQKAAPILMDPVKDLKVNDLDVIELQKERRALEQELAVHRCARCPRIGEHMALQSRVAAVEQMISEVQFRLSEANLLLMPDFNQRLTVLETLKFIDADRVVQLKGRVACEINSCESVIVTELVFENVLTPLDVPEVVALLSVLINQDKASQRDVNEDAFNLTPPLRTAYEHLKALTASFANLQMQCGLQVAPDEYAHQILNPSMIEVAYEWARGMPFRDICALTEIPEGSVVRVITRLDETCKEVRNAARVVGDSALFTKMEQCSTAIKRDIVFASSLYIS